MAGFAATGIYPVDSNIFTESDYVHADISGENECANEDSTNLSSTQPNESWEIFVFDDLPAQVEVATSEEPSTSGLSRLTFSLDEVLHDVGPLHNVTPKKKSNRGRKPMVSSVLTSAYKRNTLKAAAQKTEQNKRKKQSQSKQTPTAKRTKRRHSSSSPSDSDFCIICLETMPKKLTKNNSIKCMEYKRPVHLKCVNMTDSFFICQNCDSD